MKTLTPGHKYELANFEIVNTPGQTIQFIEKTMGANDPSGKLETINDGTTNEEVLAMLVDRINFLQSKFPCRENAIALTHIETALMWLNKRTEERRARGVEGKALK